MRPSDGQVMSTYIGARFDALPLADKLAVWRLTDAGLVATVAGVVVLTSKGRKVAA